ncbi:hypothetical protein HDV06_002544 [Boothiomyces sp. JEL0866]|nr:hypothetical protein HDV06_002544 [Boothiomyces sp. JEL0866]
MQFTKFAVFIAAVFASHPGGLDANPTGSDIGVKATTTTTGDSKPTAVPTTTSSAGKVEITSTQGLPPIITSAAPAVTTTNGKVETTIGFSTELVSTDILVSTFSETVINGHVTDVPVVITVHTVVPKVVPILSGAASYSVAGVAAAALVALAL